MLSSVQHTDGVIHTDHAESGRAKIVKKNKAKLINAGGVADMVNDVMVTDSIDEVL